MITFSIRNNVKKIIYNSELAKSLLSLSFEKAFTLGLIQFMFKGRSFMT
jgi:hypothetical protein